MSDITLRERFLETLWLPGMSPRQRSEAVLLAAKVIGSVFVEREIPRTTDALLLFPEPPNVERRGWLLGRIGFGYNGNQLPPEFFESAGQNPDAVAPSQGRGLYINPDGALVHVKITDNGQQVIEAPLSVVQLENHRAMATSQNRVRAAGAAFASTDSIGVLQAGLISGLEWSGADLPWDAIGEGVINGIVTARAT